MGKDEPKPEEKPEEFQLHRDEHDLHTVCRRFYEKAVRDHGVTVDGRVEAAFQREFRSFIAERRAGR